MKKQKILTIPNILTIIRFLLVPVFLSVFFAGHLYTALAIFVLAQITDVVDGYIARKYNMITDFGKVMDPLADKTIRIATVISFVAIKVITIPVLVLYLLPDVFLIISSAFLYNRNYVVSSNKYGKTSAVILGIAIILCFFYETISPINLYFLYFGILCSFGAAASYVVALFQKTGGKIPKKEKKGN